MLKSTTFRYILSFLLSVFGILSLHAQHDSLQQKTYQELELLYKRERYNNPKLAKIYVNEMLAKAQHSNHQKKLGEAFFKKALLETKLGVYDSAFYYISNSLKIGTAIQSDSLLLKNNNLKGNIYVAKGDYENAIDQYLVAKKIADKMGNLNDILIISHNVGMIKKQTKDLQEAEAIFLKNLARIQKENLPHYKRLEALSIFALSDTYLRMKNYRKAEQYTNLGLQKTAPDNFKDIHFPIAVNKAIIEYQQKKYVSSIDFAKSTLAPLAELNNDELLTTSYLYLGKSYVGLEAYDSAIVYFEKIEKITAEEKFSFPEMEEVYQLLSISYAKVGAQEKSIAYLTKYSELDEKNDSINVDINNKIHEKYDIVPLKKEIASLDDDNQRQQQRATYLYILLTVLALALILFVILYKRKQQQNKLRFQQLLLKIEKIEQKTAEKEVAETKETSITVTDENALQILKALETFEEKKYYLRQDCTLGYVAKKVKTNTTYLSNVINTYKEKPFKTYLTELRINEALIQLKNDEKLRSYTIKAIAEEFGFKRSETFSRAFKAHTDMYPSSYIKNLQNQLDKQ